MPNLGNLTEQITFERDATAKSPSGGTKPWSIPETVATARAKIEPVEAGREIYGNPNWVVGLGAYRILILSRTDIDVKMRVKYITPGTDVARYFSIHSIPLGGPRQNFTALICEEIK